ncbi:MAG TPA: hypothetical protein DCP52_00750, partial [Elusimicrobia bacterium]|nr:hypothetical protein [Elusimicrobiota bacterium]
MKYSRYLLLFACLVGGVLAHGAVITPVEKSASPATQDPVKNTTPAITPRGADGKPLPDITRELTLDDCIQLALANSPKAVAAQLQLQNAEVNLNLAKAEFLPTASVGASQGYTVQKVGS